MLISCDVEADGACPGIYSMVSFGAVAVREDLPSFYAQTAPLTENWNPDALKVTGFTREETLGFPPLINAMREFRGWLKQFDRPTFISDNNGFDWQFINHAFVYSKVDNPFGFSSRRIGDIYCGLVKDIRANREWKRFRKTRHTHNAADDAKGNAEALLYLKEKYNLKF